VRSLEREIATLCRKVARRRAEGHTEPVAITPAEIIGLLGAPRFLLEEELDERTRVPGVAIGLAWTPAGGDLLFIEAARAKGGKSLTLTGQLGDVMKESAQAALSYLRSKSDTLGIPGNFLERTDIHIHFPAGGIPKDGPSAGVTILTALVSLLTSNRVRSDVAMTGEVTLRGLVLPVGGIKEKVLAAHRAGIKRIIIPARNERDLVDVPEQARKELDFVFAAHMDEVLKAALEEDPIGRQAPGSPEPEGEKKPGKKPEEVRA
jgi:ATP-dependent Lon protease